MSWQFSGDRPIYIQLVEQIQRKILSGEYEPGQKLPSIREMAAQAAVNPNTLQRALSELEQKELVHTQRTIGRFISADEEKIAGLRRQHAESAANEFLDQMQALGYATGEVIELLIGIMEGEYK